MRLLPGIALALLVLGAGEARADSSASSAQFLYGWTFHEGPNRTENGNLFTLTVDNATDWKWGDTYVFADLLSGRLGDAKETDYSIYLEWQPRLSFGKILERSFAWGPFTDLLLAGEVNRAPGLNVLLLGLGTNIALPEGLFWLVNVYFRNDNFNAPTYQVTTSWTIPFHLGVGWIFTGFADIYGTNDSDVNLLTQPQLLIDVGEPLGLTAGQLGIGTEFWILASANVNTFAPQAMTKWQY